MKEETETRVSQSRLLKHRFFEEVGQQKENINHNIQHFEQFNNARPVQQQRRQKQQNRRYYENVQEDFDYDTSSHISHNILKSMNKVKHENKQLYMQMAKMKNSKKQIREQLKNTTFQLQQMQLKNKKLEVDKESQKLKNEKIKLQIERKNMDTTMKYFAQSQQQYQSSNEQCSNNDNPFVYRQQLHDNHIKSGKQIKYVINKLLKAKSKLTMNKRRMQQMQDKSKINSQKLFFKFTKSQKRQTQNPHRAATSIRMRYKPSPLIKQLNLSKIEIRDDTIHIQELKKLLVKTEQLRSDSNLKKNLKHKQNRQNKQNKQNPLGKRTKRRRRNSMAAPKLNKQNKLTKATKQQNSRRRASITNFKTLKRERKQGKHAQSSSRLLKKNFYKEQEQAYMPRNPIHRNIKSTIDDLKRSIKHLKSLNF